jgi:iron complex outermembrane receptor protein
MKFHVQARPNHARKVLFFLVPGLISTMVGPTLATAADAPSSAQDDTKLEQIVVTAERRSTDLQLSPIAATVLTGEDLTKLNVNTVDSLMFNTPSLTVQSSGENALINIRGIGKSDGGAQDSSGVLIYRDADRKVRLPVKMRPAAPYSSTRRIRHWISSVDGSRANSAAMMMCEFAAR